MQKTSFVQTPLLHLTPCTRRCRSNTVVLTSIVSSATRVSLSGLPLGSEQPVYKRTAILYLDKNLGTLRN